MIAGEGVIGILLALLAVAGVDGLLDISGIVPWTGVGADIASLVVFALVILSVLKFSVWKKSKKSE